MASNAPSSESASPPTLDPTIPSDTTAIECPGSPARARRAKAADVLVPSCPAPIANESIALPASDVKPRRSPPRKAVPRNASRPVSKRPKTELIPSRSRVLSREALLELDAVKWLIETGRAKGSVDREDLRTAFLDGQLGKPHLDGVLSVLRANGIQLARTAAPQPELDGSQTAGLPIPTHSSEAAHASDAVVRSEATRAERPGARGGATTSSTPSSTPSSRLAVSPPKRANGSAANASDAAAATHRPSVSSGGAHALSSASSDSLNPAVDPVRVYLREMGQVSLLTREGEVEIAQRIERAVDAHLSALIGNPYSLRRMVELADAIRAGSLEIKKVLDLVEDGDVDLIPLARKQFLSGMTRIQKIERAVVERRRALDEDAMTRDERTACEVELEGLFREAAKLFARQRISRHRYNELHRCLKELAESHRLLGARAIELARPLRHRARGAAHPRRAFEEAQRGGQAGPRTPGRRSRA